jgi:hypothetical protein
MSSETNGAGWTEKTEKSAPDTKPEVSAIIPQIVTLAVMSGDAPITAGCKIAITSTGIEFLGDMSIEQWREILRSWQKAGSIYHIGLADILGYGKAKFGEQAVDDTLELFGFDMADVLKANAIGQLLLEIRTESLTSEHLYILSKSLPNEKKEQGRWAAIATKEGLSAVELKQSIEEGKIVRQQQINRDSGRDSGVPNIEGLALVFQRWEKQAGGQEKILAQPLDWKRKFLEEIDPIVDLAAKVKETLPPEDVT